MEISVWLIEAVVTREESIPLFHLLDAQLTQETVETKKEFNEPTSTLDDCLTCNHCDESFQRSTSNEYTSHAARYGEIVAIDDYREVFAINRANLKKRKEKRSSDALITMSQKEWDEYLKPTCFPDPSKKKS